MLLPRSEDSSTNGADVRCVAPLCAVQWLVHESAASGRSVACRPRRGSYTGSASASAIERSLPAGCAVDLQDWDRRHNSRRTLASRGAARSGCRLPSDAALCSHFGQIAFTLRPRQSIRPFMKGNAPFLLQVAARLGLPSGHRLQTGRNRVAQRSHVVVGSCRILSAINEPDGSPSGHRPTTIIGVRGNRDRMRRIT